MPRLPRVVPPARSIDPPPPRRRSPPRTPAPPALATSIPAFEHRFPSIDEVGPQRTSIVEAGASTPEGTIRDSRRRCTSARNGARAAFDGAAGARRGARPDFGDRSSSGLRGPVRPDFGDRSEVLGLERASPAPARGHGGPARAGRSGCSTSQATLASLPRSLGPSRGTTELTTARRTTPPRPGGCSGFARVLGLARLTEVDASGEHDRAPHGDVRCRASDRARQDAIRAIGRVISRTW